MRKTNRMSRLEAELDEANRTIDFLRAKLCAGNHSYVLVSREKAYTNIGLAIDMNVKDTYVCTKCGYRKVEE